MNKRITSEEIDFIRSHPKIPAKEIATALGRTFRSVTEIRHKYGFLSIRQRRFTLEELDFIRSHPTWSARMIGEALGRTRDSIIQIRHRHGLPLIPSSRVPNSMRYTPEDLAFIAAHPELTAKAIGRVLHRTAGGISAVRHRKRNPNLTKKAK